MPSIERELAVSVKVRSTKKPLPTIWEIPGEPEGATRTDFGDALSARTGSPRTDPRQVMNGIICRMRSGAQWNQLPRRFGDGVG